MRPRERGSDVSGVSAISDNSAFRKMLEHVPMNLPADPLASKSFNELDEIED